MTALEHATLQELRDMRASARRALELLRMRARPDDQQGADEIDALRTTVDETTEELIHRYEQDLSLVDSLLGAPYARRTSRQEAGES